MILALALAATLSLAFGQFSLPEDIGGESASTSYQDLIIEAQSRQVKATIQERTFFQCYNVADDCCSMGDCCDIMDCCIETPAKDEDCHSLYILDHTYIISD